jgi:hypothetical protein
MYTCPSCDRPINSASEVCPYCGKDIAPSPPGKRSRDRRQGLLMTLFGSAVLVCGVWALVWFVLPRPPVAPHRQAEAYAVSSMRQIATAVFAFAKREGGYPASIEQVSDQTSSAFETALQQGYHIVYRAGAAGNDGDIHTFTLLARPEYYGFWNLYTDQTGVIRATREDRPARAQDPPIP